MRNPRARRGMTYPMVLTAATLVFVIGVSALTASRIQNRAAATAIGAGEARFLARSAIELGRRMIAQDNNWRTTQVNGDWLSETPLGEGTLSLAVVDPADGDLDDWPRGDVRFTATGRCRGATYRLRTTLKPEFTPLEILGTALHANGAVTVSLGASLALSGGPLSSNGLVTLLGPVYGDVQALAVSGLGVGGSWTQLSTARTMPGSSVFGMYLALATPITPGSTIDRAVIAAGYNSLGSTNANGIYSINSPLSNVQIGRTRLNGTLVVNVGVNKLSITDEVFFAPHRTDAPVLIVNGNLEISYSSDTKPLSETSAGKNFNPPGAPYLGTANMTMSDTMPHEIRGLVHVYGNLTISGPVRIRGVVIVHGSVTCGSNAEIIRDPEIYQTPPPGYEATLSMQPVPGTWQPTVLP